MTSAVATAPIISSPPDPEVAETATTFLATSIDDIHRVARHWTALRSRTGVFTPNNDIVRFVTTVQQQGQAVSPYVLSIQMNGEPAAVLVARSQRRRPRHRIGYFSLPAPVLRCLDVVYGGVLADDSRSGPEAVLSHLRAQLAARVFDRVTFNHLPSDCALAAAACGAPNVRRRAIVGAPERHWRLELVPHSYERTIGGFSRKHRYNMRRADRLLCEHFGNDVTLRRFSAPEEVAELAAGSARIVARTYQAALGAAFSDNAMQRALLHLEAERGRLRAYWLQCGVTPIAFQIGAAYGRTYHLLATAFLPEHARLSPGQVLLVRVIQDLCDAGFEYVDYGFGDARYKRIYGSQCWDETTVSLYGPSSRATRAMLMHRVAEAVGAKAGQIASRTATRDRLRKWWRARLTPGDGNP